MDGSAHALLGSGFLLRLAVGTGLGFAIGLERELRQRSAGLQTTGLVTVAATLFATIAPSFGMTNDLRIVANIVTGVGFLAGGVIFKDGANVRGLNTAATIWAAAAVGTLAGIGLLAEATAAAGVIVLLNSGVGFLVDYIDRHFRKGNL
ncbi:MAG TPA: MgtC/SapB family protein [Candidatus Tumulicola sp.]